MSLPSLNLDAFLAVSKTRSFSSAARMLNVTQSALSQRVKNLEDELGLTLFIRVPTGVMLTAYGERLLRYCQIRDTMEEELLHDLSLSNGFELRGTIKIAAYSSVLRSVLIPSLSSLLEKHPNILFEFVCSRIDELPGLLQRAEVDFIVTDSVIERENIQTKILGQESYVVIERKSGSQREDFYLDNDPSDRATELFFRSQVDVPTKRRRSYLSDCYGILDGVARGLGKAVMPEHLLLERNKIKILKGYKPYKVNVILHYYIQPFYSKLHQVVVDCLIKGVPEYLNPKRVLPMNQRK